MYTGYQEQNVLFINERQVMGGNLADADAPRGAWQGESVPDPLARPSTAAVARDR